MSSKSDESSLPVANAYEIIPNKEREESVMSVGVEMSPSPCVELDRPLGNGVSPEFLGIPEARGLTWQDDFFDEEEGVIAVFDFDYDHMECHYKTVSWGCLGGMAFCFPNLLPCLLLGLVPCHINKNVRWNVRAQHLAVTRDGILFVHDKRPCLWGDQCAVGRRTKTIPFDQITDCTVTEGGSATCAIGPAPLSTVEIDTATSKKKIHELRVVGLRDPWSFRKLLLAMKRQPVGVAVPSSVPVSLENMVDRALAGPIVPSDTNAESSGMFGLLREIRDQLQQHNELLQSMKQPQRSNEVLENCDKW